MRTLHNLNIHFSRCNKTNTNCRKSSLMVSKLKSGHTLVPGARFQSSSRSTPPSQFLRHRKPAVRRLRWDSLAVRSKPDIAFRLIKIPSVDENGRSRQAFTKRLKPSTLKWTRPTKRKWRRELCPFQGGQAQACKVARSRRACLIWSQRFKTQRNRQSRCSQRKLILKCSTFLEIFTWCH